MEIEVYNINFRPHFDLFATDEAELVRVLTEASAFNGWNRYFLNI